MQTGLRLPSRLGFINHIWLDAARRCGPLLTAAIFISVWLALLSVTAHAETKTLTGPFSNTITTRFPTPLPSGGQATSFTTWSGSAVPFAQGSFYVSTAGTYTAQLSGLSTMSSPVAVGAYFLTEEFAPNPAGPSTTPLTSFIVGQQGFPSTIIFSNLTPGVRYNYLLLFSSGTSGTFTLTLSGPGSICLGSTCGDGPSIANALSRTMMQQRANAVTSVSVGDYTHSRLASSLVSGSGDDQNPAPVENAARLGGPRPLDGGQLLLRPTALQATSDVTSADQAGTPDPTSRKPEAQLGFGVSGNVDPNNPGNVRLAFNLDRVRKSDSGKQPLPPGISYLGATEDASPVSRPYNIWSEYRRAYFRDGSVGDRRSGHVSVSSTGVDYLIAPWLIAGVMVQWDWIDLGLTDVLIRSTGSGNGWLAGPYVSMRLTPNVFFDARVAGGKTDNQVTPLGTYEDSFETRRWLVSGELSGQWDFGPWRIKPAAELIYLKDEQKSYASLGGGIVPGQTYELGRLTFGPEIIYRAIVRGDIVIEPFAAIDGVWDFATDGSLTTTGLAVAADEFRGRVELGASIVLPSTAGLQFSGTYDGIGSDNYSSYEGRASLHVPF